MPVTADRERELLNKYKLATLHPEKWPGRDHDSDDDDEPLQHQTNDLQPNRHASKLSVNSRSSVSRYRNIDRHASVRSTTTDSESLVQKDEPDALGMAPSVASELKRRGLPIDDNLKLRNRFMLSSTTFNPPSFLATVHQDASTEDLLRGLDHLSQSIEQKSASLKVLVESNFEKFVKAKATIDNVYTEMRTQGVDPAENASASSAQADGGKLSHSRQTSKGQTHFRSASGRLSASHKKSPLLSTPDKKKNALTKESEYGVQGIKAPLLEVAVKAEEVWGPALGGREKEEMLKEVLSTMDQHRAIFNLNGNLGESIKRNDYENVVSAYKQAKRHANAARNLADISRGNQAGLSDADARQIIITAKMWHDVEIQIAVFKTDVLRRLRESHGRRPAAVTQESDKEEHMELIGVLIQLGVDENPIWQWLNTRYLYLRDKIVRSFERSRVEIEVLRRKIGNSRKTDMAYLAKFLRSAADTDTVRLVKGAPGLDRDLDTAPIMSFWEQVHSSLSTLLSMQNGILGEAIEYWETAQSFIDNKAQKAFSNAVVAAGREHLELEPDDVQNLRAGAVELVNIIRENVLSFFCDPPVEDLSDLYSPIPPPTPITPDTNLALTSPSLRKSFSFSLDATGIPPPEPKRGDSWEKYAFWPPQSNCISASLYLGRLLVLVGTAASEMAALNVIKQSNGGVENLKTLVASVRERCVTAVCNAWDTDAARCKYLETWTRQAERRDLTTLPVTFAALEERIISNMQKIAYITDANSTISSVRNGSGGAEVIQPPPNKLLQALRGSFVTSLYKALSGMVENAERERRSSLLATDPDGVTLPKSERVDGDERVTIAVDSASRDIRLLLILSNVSHLRADLVPHLISQFETAFSVKLTDETKTIRDVLGQIDARLFQAYVLPTVEQLKASISEGIASPAWVPIVHPTDASPYIYDVLLKLVLVHSEITSTSPTLTNQILSYLLEQSSQALIAAFKSRTNGAPEAAGKYTLPALMQATLDVEFMAQTLNNYTTEKAGEVQTQIYLALDERTDNEARAKLQEELPNMRAVLKRLREGTKGEFGCFKKERRGRAGGGERAGTSTGTRPPAVAGAATAT